MAQTGAALNAQRFSMPEQAQVEAVIHQLQLLADDLGKRGCLSRVLMSDGGSWGIHAVNPSAPEYSDLVYADQDEGGVWWLWWSWKDRLTLIDEIDVAADTIAAVLEPLK